MPYQGMPVVREKKLWVSGVALCEVGSPEWFDWLEQENHFCYFPKHPYYRLTFRKEKRRNSWYWFAYIKVDSKLHNAYVGSSSSLSEEKLKTVAEQLLEKVRQTKRQMTIG